MEFLCVQYICGFSLRFISTATIIMLWRKNKFCFAYFGPWKFSGVTVAGYRFNLKMMAKIVFFRKKYCASGTFNRFSFYIINIFTIFFVLLLLKENIIWLFKVYRKKFVRHACKCIYTRRKRVSSISKVMFSFKWEASDVNKHH